MDVGGRGEKMWRIQCWSLVKVRRSRPPVRLNISKRTILLEERKLSFESQEQIECMEYMYVCALAHNGPQTCLQSQDTAKILVCPKHFSPSVHFISTELSKHNLNKTCMIFTNAVVWHGVSRAHGTQRETAAMAVPCAHDTPRQATEFMDVIYGSFTKDSSDSVKMKCTEAKKCSRHTRILAVSWLCGRVYGPLWPGMHTML